MSSRSPTRPPPREGHTGGEPPLIEVIPAGRRPKPSTSSHLWRSASRRPPDPVQAQRLVEGQLVAEARLIQAQAKERRRLASLAFLDPDFVRSSDGGTVLAAAVDAAVLLTGADMGNVQRVDPVHGTLQIAAQYGFEPPFLEFFAEVHEGQAACSRASQCGVRVIVEDVTKSPIFLGTPALDVMLDARARAVQSTPLIGASGRLLGMFSTHYHRPQRPTARDLRRLDLLGHRTARILEWMSAPTGPEP